jgi:hypothetical protein
MHAVELRADGPPRVKVYLFPRAAAGPPVDVVRATLERSGMGDSWGHIARLVGALTPHAVALDLEAAGTGRCKLYFCPRAGVDSVEAIAALCPGWVPGDGEALLRALTGATAVRRPLWVALHLVAGAPLGRPVRATVDVPVRSYVEDDDTVVERVAGVLDRAGHEASAYRRLAAVFAAGGRSAVPGLHSFVSVQREGGRPRVTTYFNSRAHAPGHGWCAADPDRFWPGPVPGADPGVGDGRP